MMNQHFGSVIAALQTLDTKQLDRLLVLVKAMRQKDRTIWLCGNGGSYATAQHWATDLCKAAWLRAVALGSNMPLLTAWANDQIFASVFETEMELWAQAGDLLICLSCSGISQNVSAAVAVAKERNITSVLLTGTLNTDVAPADHIVRVWSQDMKVIEDCHSAIGHWLIHELTR